MAGSSKQIYRLLSKQICKSLFISPYRRSILCHLSAGESSKINKRTVTSLSESSHPRKDIINENNEIFSKYPDLEVPNVSIMDYCFELMKENKSSLGMVNTATNARYTWGDMAENIRKVSSGLVRLGYKKGDVVCIFNENCPEFTMMMMAVISLGGIVTTANPLYTADELKRQLEDSKAKAIFVSSASLAETARNASRGNPRVKDIIAIDDVPNCVLFSYLLEDNGRAFTERLQINPPEDIAVLPYSSGTTGLPKGVMLSHSNIIANVLQIKNVLPNVQNLRSLAILPFYHIYGLVVLQFVAVSNNFSVHTVANFEPSRFLQLLQDEKISMLNAVPPMVLMLAKHPDVPKYDLSHIRYITSGAAPLGRELTESFLERFPDVEIFQAYGLTETSPGTHVDTPPPHFGTIGSLIPNTRAKVVDIETGSNLGPNQAGELCIKGPQVMKGYLNNQEATDNIMKDGWLHTGDMAKYDEEGIFTIVDRLKELIKYKGFQIAPAELESILLTHPDIQDVGVIGIPDDYVGEVPRAFILLKEGKSLTESDVTNFLEGKVAPYKKLRGGVYFVNSIPKTASGKILRRKLKEISPT